MEVQKPLSVFSPDTPREGWGFIQIEVIQLNCHNARQAHTELGLIMSKHSNVVALTQEPYVNGKKQLACLPKGYDVFPGKKDGHPRTAIIASRQLKLTEINEICSNNITARGGLIGDNRIILAGIYMHYDKEVILEEMKTLIDYCRRNTFQLIIAADSNAHSNLWGPEPKRTCKRGERLEEWILKEGMVIHNIGEQPTFENKRCSSAIYITISLNLKPDLRNWTVQDLSLIHI